MNHCVTSYLSCPRVADVHERVRLGLIGIKIIPVGNELRLAPVVLLVTLTRLNSNDAAGPNPLCEVMVTSPLIAPFSSVSTIVG